MADIIGVYKELIPLHIGKLKYWFLGEIQNATASLLVEYQSLNFISNLLWLFTTNFKNFGVSPPKLEIPKMIYFGTRAQRKFWKNDTGLKTEGLYSTSLVGQQQSIGTTDLILPFCHWFLRSKIKFFSKFDRWFWSEGSELSRKL